MDARRYNKGKVRMSLLDPFADCSLNSCGSFKNTAEHNIRESMIASSSPYHLLLKAAQNINLAFCEEQSLPPVDCGIHPKLKYELGKVYTVGAAKYSDYDENGNIVYDGSNNWRLGLTWSCLYDSLLRHLNAWQLDYRIDDETGCHHGALALWNVYALLNHIKYHPHKDNRWTPKVPKIGLDIDGPIADFAAGFAKEIGLPEHVPHSWNDPVTRLHFPLIMNRVDFWLNLPLNKDLIEAPMPFCPVAYITSRPIDIKFTKQYLFDKHQLPYATVIDVGLNKSKVDACKATGVEIFVDDRYENYEELNRNGIYCMLYTRPHNKHYNVGSRRIDNLHQLKRIWS